MLQSKAKEMILNDNMLKTCLKLSMPAVIAMLLYGLNTFLDGIFIGRIVGETAFAAVSLVSPLTAITLGLGALAGVGAGSYLSILIGQDNKELQRRIIGNTNSLILIMAAISIVLGIIFLNPVLRLIGAKQSNWGFASDYFLTTLYGSIFWIGGITYNMIVRAEGRMGTAAIMMGMGNIVNVIANYLLMGVFHFGVKGAAWGTNISMFIYVVLFFVYCKLGKPSFETNEWKFYFDIKIIKEIVSIGTPALIMTTMNVIQGLFTRSVLNAYGTELDLAFYGVIMRVIQMLMTPLYGLMRALQPAVGINFGAGKMDRVIGFYKVFTAVAFVLVLPMWIISTIYPGAVIAVMLPETTFSAINLHYFRTLITIIPLLCVVLTAMTFYPAIKKPLPALLFGVGRQLFLYIPLMIILPRYFGIAAIYYGGLGIDVFLTLVICFMLANEFRILRKLQAEKL